MYILEYFKFFPVQTAQESFSRNLQTVPDNADRILRLNLPGLVRPSQMIGIDGIPAFRVNHERLDPICQYKIFRIRIQRSFVTLNRQFLPLLTEQGNRHRLQKSTLILFKKPCLFGIHLPLDLIALGLRKAEL